MNLSTIIVYYICCYTLMETMINLHQAEAIHFTALKVRMKHTQVTYVMNKMFTCAIIQKMSISEQQLYIFDCMSPYIGHCRPSDEPLIINRIYHHPNFAFCGLINIPQLSSFHNKIYLHVLRKHVLQLHFLLFIFYRTFDVCGPDELKIIEYPNKTSVYCGSRLPWKMISTGRKCVILLKVLSGSTSRMTMFYHALYNLHISSVMVHDYWIPPTRPLPNTAHLQESAHGFTVIGLPYQVIFLELTWGRNEAFYDITVFDGPGSYSATILSLYEEVEQGVYNRATTAFSMYILVKYISYKFDKANITLESLNSIKTERCKTHFNEWALTNQFHSLYLKPKNTRENFACSFKTIHLPALPYPIIYLKELEFTGPNTLESFHANGCDYGGFFLRVFHDNSSHIEIGVCESLIHFVWYPNVSRIELLVIWYAGYSSGHVKGQIKFTNCPTSHITDSLLMSNFDKEASCHYYVCHATACTLHLAKKNESFGPGFLQIATSSNLQIRFINFEPFKCENKVTTKSVDINEWITEKETSKYYVFKSHMDNFIEAYKFLHNVTVSIKTCEQSVIGIGLVISQCEKVTNLMAEYAEIDVGMVVEIYKPCDRREFITTTFYHTYPTDVEIVLIIKRAGKCDPLCSRKTISIQEAIPHDGVVYKYNFTFDGHFKWHTHRRHGGFSFTVYPLVPCEYGISCEIQIVTEIADGGINEGAVYDYHLSPMG